MKNILLLTDFSNTSKNAIRYALQLFEGEICSFFMLHVQLQSSYISDDLIAQNNASVYDTLIKKSKHKLDKLIVTLEDEFKNKKHNFISLIDYDSLTAAIEQAIKAHNIELIVMGSNGVTGAKEIVFGSNTINVIRKVDCTTLVIPEKFKYQRPNEILLPLDLFDSISGSAFVEIIKFTNKFAKKMHLLRTKPNNENSKEEKKDKGHIKYFLSNFDYEYHVIRDIPIHFTTSCYLQTHNIDVVALIVQKESLFERFFTGSPTTKITNQIKVPLLIGHSN